MSAKQAKRKSHYKYPSSSWPPLLTTGFSVLKDYLTSHMKYVLEPSVEEILSTQCLLIRAHPDSVNASTFPGCICVSAQWVSMATHVATSTEYPQDGAPGVVGMGQRHLQGAGQIPCRTDCGSPCHIPRNLLKINRQKTNYTCFS